MHRSSSTSRASEEFFIHAASPSTKPPQGLRTQDTNNELPVYDPNSDAAKKEKMRIKFAENAVHIIPLVLVICAITLWFFSNTEVEMANKDSSHAAKVEGLTIDGDIDVHGTGTGLLSSEDLEPPKKVSHHHKSGRASREKSG